MPSKRTPKFDVFFYRPDEDAGALDQFAHDTSAPSEVNVEREEPREHLAFVLDKETWAVPIDQVREILKVPPLTEVPRGGDNLLGVMNLRGEVLPVYDVKPRLGLADKPRVVTGPKDVPRSARVVLVRDPVGDAGLLVDRVTEVVKLLPSKVEPPPPGVAAQGGVSGIGRKGSALFLLLDVEAVLN